MDAPAPRFTTPLELIRWIALAQRKAAEEWNREREVSFEQGFAIRLVTENPGLVQRDIARMTRTTAASVSSLLQGLERRGLVERRTEDGDERSKRVYPTAAAREVIAGFESAMAAIDDGILAPLSAGERADLQALLAKITAELPEPTR
jgi:MarR family transcriptional regulator, repressor for mepA